MFRTKIRSAEGREETDIVRKADYSYSNIQSDMPRVEVEKEVD